MMLPFSPGSVGNITVTGTSDRIAIPSGGPQLLLTNVGTQVVYVLLGNSGVVSTTTTGFAMLPNTSRIITHGKALNTTAGEAGAVVTTGVTHIAAIASTTGSTLNVVAGTGF